MLRVVSKMAEDVSGICLLPGTEIAGGFASRLKKPSPDHRLPLMVQASVSSCDESTSTYWNHPGTVSAVVLVALLAVVVSTARGSGSVGCFGFEFACDDEEDCGWRGWSF